MGITQKDLNISNISYTNKDFASIYPEVLESATKISYKFKPDQSNEADPFIVLAKEASFVADKINYNIDKNVLERFMTSATQNKSMRELTSMMGYNMKYYQSATTKLVCKYNYNGNEVYSGETKSSVSNGIYIPPFTKFLNNTGDIIYTSIGEAYINPTTKSSDDIYVIQGEVKDLSVLESTTITFENLDENRRLYFPERMVAENGIFIEGGSSDYDSSLDTLDWKKSNNLNTEVYGSYVYIFGYDSTRKLPYIEFPEWITQIIGGGLSIKYTVTSGVDGNVSAKSITTINLSSDYLPTYESGATVSSDNITVINSYAANNGEDPETINEAYVGFKKTVGTFDTLVACRDYANAIYNLTNDYGTYLASNVQVSDRRTDINYGCLVSTFIDSGPQVVSMPSSSITAYNLCLYPLTYSSDLEYSTTLESYDGYNKTFNAIFNPSAIEEALEDSKCLSHDYKRYAVNDIYAIKNYYKLEAIISTSTKVNSYEQAEIILNVNNALAKNFNAREVDFGYEIPYNNLLKVIEEADSRIKSVSLYEPDITTKGYLVNGVDGTTGRITSMTEVATNTGGATPTDTDWFKTIVAKNILAGRIEMLNYDEAFNYHYGETSGAITNEVKTFTSLANINSSQSISANTPYTLLANEVIEIISPNYITDGSVYPYGVNYYLILTGGKTQLDKNSVYTLAQNERLIMQWTDSNDESQDKFFEAGSLIKPNFDMKTTAKRIADGETPTAHRTLSDGNAYDLFTLGTKEEVEKVKVNSQTMNTKKYVYWHLNNNTNTINWGGTGNNEYILEQNEYFFYTDINFSELYSFGSGTLITKNGFSGITDWTMAKVSDISTIVDSDMDALREMFRLLECDGSNTLTFTEQEIITLVANNKIKANASISIPNNTFGNIATSTSVEYSTDEGTTWVTLGTKPDAWRIRALLDLCSGPNLAQTLVGYQAIDFSTSTSTVPLTNGDTFKLSELMQITGGNTKSLAYIDLNLKTAYPDLYKYTLASQEHLTSFNTQLKDNYYALDIPSNKVVTLYLPTLSGTSTFFMLYVNLPSGVTAQLSVSPSGGTYVGYNKAINNNEITTSGMYVIKTLGVTDFIITFTGTTMPYAVISKPRIVKSSETNPLIEINPLLGLKSSTDIKSFISTNFSSQWADFNVTNFIDNTRKIEVSSSYPLSSPDMFYDYNNIANKWTIPVVDLTESDIRIARSSQKAD